MTEDRIIVALDLADPREIDVLCAALAGKVRMLKVGLQLFLSQGPSIVGEIRRAGFDVFLDLKLHDIPHQVSLACAEIVKMGAAMFTVHTTGGTAMLETAVEATRAAASDAGTRPPAIVGVTVLTSLDTQNLISLGVEQRVEDQVSRLAGLALDAGLDGVVASAREVERLRREYGDGFVAVTPGIRPSGAGGDDQNRTATPAEALAAGSTYLVVGRPVTSAPDPAAALAAVLDELDKGV